MTEKEGLCQAIDFAFKLTLRVNKVFRLFDDDGTGTVTIRNLRRVARELGETMTDEELQEMIDRADSNGDSAVTPDDFYNIMTKKTFV